LSFNPSEWDKIPELISQSRTTIRNLIKAHFARTNHDEDRKLEELSDFLTTFRFMTKKWNVEILYELELHDGLNFNELRRHMRNISARTLSDSLKQLSEYGLVHREIINTRPPSVNYHLADGGKGFIELSLLLIFHLQTVKSENLDKELSEIKEE
jgi:DNA-binding HxlR family transcriptional regulator